MLLFLEMTIQHSPGQIYIIHVYIYVSVVAVIFTLTRQVSLLTMDEDLEETKVKIRNWRH